MVYFLQFARGGPLKIGFTSGHLRKRLRDLQAGSPYRLRVLAVIGNGDKDREHRLHRRFRHSRLCSEWHRATRSW